MKQVTDLYAENALETDQAQQNPGVELALYFQRKAPSIASAYGILADRKILSVVQTALDISPMSAHQPIDQQAALLKKQVRVADFQDPAKLQKFIMRFAAMYDSKHGLATGPNSTNAIPLGAAQATGAGIGFALLQSLQTYRAG